jgi:hypothetical protein
MKIKIIIALIFSMILFGGCEKKLDIVPTFASPEELALSSTDGMDAGLSYAYSCIHAYIGLTFSLWSELMADHLYYQGTLTNYSNYYKRDLNAVIQETVSSTDTRVVNSVILRQVYDGMNTASLILRAVDNGYANSDVTFAPNKNRIQGECHFIRAICYFEAVRFWAKAWGATADNSQPGLVMNTEPVDDRVSQLKPRSTVAEVYAFIIDDLTQAIALLPDAYDGNINPVSYNGRANKDAAIAYLAKVYFQQQDYVKAKAMIDLVMGSTAGSPSKHPLDGNVITPFNTRGANNTDPENIYQTTSSLDVNSLVPFWYSGNTAIFMVANTSVALQGFASNAFIADAKFGPGDLRRSSFFRIYPNGNMLPIKYSIGMQINIPIIRSAEMILDRAEINALAGNINDAVNDVNLTRIRAQIPILAGNISQGPLVDSIRTERIRELCFEGDRLWDLKRQRVTIPPGDRAGVAPLPWDGVDLVLKYAAEEVSKNPYLVNNY